MKVIRKVIGFLRWLLGLLGILASVNPKVPVIPEDEPDVESE